MDQPPTEKYTPTDVKYHFGVPLVACLHINSYTLSKSERYISHPSQSGLRPYDIRFVSYFDLRDDIFLLMGLHNYTEVKSYMLLKHEKERFNGK